MEKAYWIGRNRAAMAMARHAATSESRLIHYELAGRYSIRAAHCLPFLLPDRGPATDGEREALRLPAPGSHPRGFPARRKPGAAGGDGR